MWPFKHLDLMEAAGRIHPDRPLSARGKRYISTDPGQGDLALLCVALALKEIWASAPGREIRFSEIEEHEAVSRSPGMSIRVPAAIKRLARIKQVSIDFDREGVSVTPGSSWIET